MCLCSIHDLYSYAYVIWYRIIPDNIYIYIYIYVCMYIHTHVYAHAHTYTESPPQEKKPTSPRRKTNTLLPARTWPFRLTSARPCRSWSTTLPWPIPAAMCSGALWSCSSRAPHTVSERRRAHTQQQMSPFKKDYISVCVCVVYMICIVIHM